MSMVVMTEELLNSGKSAGPCGQWNRKQLAALGVPWPLVSGWKARLIGQSFSEEAVANFVALKGDAGKVPVVDVLLQCLYCGKVQLRKSWHKNHERLKCDGCQGRCELLEVYGKSNETKAN